MARDARQDRWWGLWVNGDLRLVQWFAQPPDVLDFSLGFFSSEADYEIAAVAILRYAHPLESD